MARGEEGSTVLEACLQNAQQGDREAANELMRIVGEVADAWFRRHEGQAIGAEARSDLVQSVAWRFWRRVPAMEFRGGAQFVALIQRYAKNLASQKRRGPRTRIDRLASLSGVLDGGREPASVLEGVERLEIVRKLLQDVKEPDRVLLERVRLEGRSYAEVASELGIEEAAARQRISRLMLRIGRALELATKEPLEG